MLATAVEEGVIRHNAARDVRLPSGRDALRRFDEDARRRRRPRAREGPRADSRAARRVPALVDPRGGCFELLAGTGLRGRRRSRCAGRPRPRRRRPAVRVQRAYVKGRYGPPKSQHGRRDVPLGFALVKALRERRTASEWHEDHDLVFPSLAGTPMSAENLARRTLKPAVQEAGAGWAAYHSFRHTARRC